MANVALSKVQSVTGHKSDRMTEWYTHYDAKEFAEIRNVQETLLLPEAKTENKKDITKQDTISDKTKAASKNGNRRKLTAKSKQKAGRVKKQA